MIHSLAVGPLKKAHFYILVKKLSFVKILHQLRCVILNICVNLDTSFQTFMSHWTIFLSHWTFLVILVSVAKDHFFY